MKLSLGQLRQLVHEAYSGSRSEESYGNELPEDDAYSETSILVPDDVKKTVNAWLKSMGLSHAKKKKQTR